MILSSSGLEEHRFSCEADDEQLLHRYEALVGRDVLDELRSYRKRFKGRKIIHVSSTFIGGGVAELLRREVKLSNELGIEMEWYKIHGNDHFFNTTKGFHNALQGKAPDDPRLLIEQYHDFYNNGGGELNRNLISYLKSVDPGHTVLIHDPQPLYLINFMDEVEATKLWRIHIDTTSPEPLTMCYVAEHATKYDGIISTMEHYVKPHVNGFGNLFTLAPSIDPFSDKNIEMEQDEINRRVLSHGFRRDLPLLVQVSRLDPWKDPVGVIHAFEKIRNSGKECQLALVYNSASDDPEGAEMERIVRAEREQSPYKDDILLVVGDDPRDVNAFQRYADLVIQKSIREGFGLTVTEALYKGNLVVATEVGGIKLQVQNHSTGYTIDPYRVDRTGKAICNKEYDSHITSLAERCIHVLNSPEVKKSISNNGRKTVLNNFLATSKLKRLYDIILSLDS
jgi:trehalose synthase